MKKNKKMLIILISIVSLLIIGSILYFCVIKNNNNQNHESENNQQTNNIINESKDDVSSDESTINKLILRKLEINKNENYDIKSFVKSCIIDESKDCDYKYETEEMSNYKESGIYDIVIIANDKNGNNVKEKTKLIINDKETIKEQNNEIDSNLINDDKKDDSNSDDILNNNSNTMTTTNTTTSQSEQSKYVVDTMTENSEELSYKYGVTIKKTITYVYDVYNDGSKNLVNTYDDYSYDYSTFNATTNDMRSEASSIANNSREIINEVLNYTNSYRSEVGESNLTLDWTLTEAATVRALEMGWANYFDHARPNGDSCFTIIDEYGISYWTVGENIAYGYFDAASVSDGWKNSPGHYANMIKSNFGRIGIGYAEVNGSRYWVQLFAD